MENDPVRRVVVVGGGTAGWMAAAVLTKSFSPGRLSVTVVESPEIGTVGVGEATIPPILQLNAQLGLDEADLVRRTGATYKLGIQFQDWGALGDRYFHPFGTCGADLGGVHFHQHWLRTRLGTLAEYSLPTMAAAAGKFARPSDDPRNVLSKMDYALHFDATLYAGVLRDLARSLGARHILGRIVDVRLNSERGFVDSLHLADGRDVEGDLYIDCSGFRGLLIEEALQTGYIGWRQWLPMDRALAVPSATTGEPPPFTRASAGTAGWRWRIPLQHRVGNGHVYCSEFLDDEAAEAALLDGLESAALATPRQLRFTTGRRRLSWNRNVVALGLASGFVEPLESTSIHLVQRGIATLMSLFPSAGFNQTETDEFNRLMAAEMEAVRDFVILHYKLTRRDDSPFWRHVRDMQVPDSLAHRMALFARAGRLFIDPNELFSRTSWVAVMMGQGLTPQTYDALADSFPEAEISGKLQRMRALIARAVEVLPSHGAFLSDGRASIAM